MSFHSTLIADAVWPADIRAALSLSDAASVYAGRRPRNVRQSVEVWIERLEVVQVGRGGGDQTEDHRYALHVVSGLSNLGGDQAGKAQQDTVEARMRTLVDRYDGLNPLESSLADCICMQAEEGSLDEDPDEDGVLSGSVLVSFFRRA